jgi:hypothetical protein
MTTSIYIDSCAWNYLFDHHINLGIELPPDRYTIFMTREVEIEVASIPDDSKDGKDKRPLKRFIEESVTANRVRTTSVFGFASVEPDGSLSKVQVCGGFDQGTFQSEEDRTWYASEAAKLRLSSTNIKNSGLSRDQGDASLAVRSFDSIVLTDERKGKAGPLNMVLDQGGRVVFLSDEVGPSGLSLGEYLADLMAKSCGSVVA